MRLSAFMQDLLRAPDEDSGPCSSLIIQHSYRTRHIANALKQPGSKSPTPSTCNANGIGGQDAGQSFALLYPAQCQLTVDGHVVDWDLNQAFANVSSFLEPVSVNDIKLLSSSDSPPCASQKGNPSFPPWFLALLLLKLLIIQCIGNGSHPSSSSSPFGTKHTLPFGNDQGGNKKPRKDDNDDNDDPDNPDDYGDNGRNHDNNDGETPEGKGAAKGKDKEKGPLFCCVFHKLDPVRWPVCGERRLTSFAYLLQHLRRQHLMKFEGHFYCPNCRTTWPPKEKGSEALWIAHKRANACQEVTAADTGMLLPDEYEAIKSSKTTKTDCQRWYETWKMLFRDYDAPDTPYREDIAQQTEASILCKLKRALKKSLSTLPPGALQDQIKTFTDGVLEDVFPAYAMQGSANAGPSTSRVPEHAPQAIGQPSPATSTPTPVPTPASASHRTGMPAGHRAPPPRPTHPRSTGFRTNPGLPVNRGFMNNGLPTNNRMMNPALLENSTIAMHHGLMNTRIPVGPRLMDTRLPENPALTRNPERINTTHSRYMNPRQASLGLMNYGPAANPGNVMDTIDPRFLTNPGPSNPGPSANPPPNLNTIQDRNMNSFRRNNNTTGIDHAAFASSVGRGIEAFYSSQDPEQPSDTDDYPETGQNPWQRIR